MLVQIKPYVYLSDIESANCKQCLLQNKIIGRLTVDSEPLDTGCYRNCIQHGGNSTETVSYTHLRAHETSLHLVCRLLLEKKK